MTETWRPVDGATGYEVSDTGLVRGPKGTVLKAQDNGHGYRQVPVRGQHRYIHRLVARAFHGAAPVGHEVRHLDGDKTNNRAVNLQWGTRSENIRDQVGHGTHRTAGHRPTHCIRGHEFDERNTYLHDGRQHCRRCRADAQYRRTHPITITEVTN